LQVHPDKGTRKAAESAGAEGEPEVWIALEDGGADDGGDDVDEVHLEAGDAGEERRPAGEPLLLVDLARGQRRERVEVERQADVVHGLPEGLPDRMPHGLHVPGAGELHASEPAAG